MALRRAVKGRIAASVLSSASAVSATPLGRTLDLDLTKNKGNYVWDRRSSLWYNRQTNYFFDSKQQIYTKDPDRNQWLR